MEASMRVRNILKVFASYLILILLAIAVMDFFLTPKIQDIMTKSIEDNMFGIASIITLIPNESMPQTVPEIAKQLNIRVTFIDSVGRVVLDSQAEAKLMENHLDRPEIQQAKTEGRGKASRFSVTRQESMLYVALPLKEQDKIKGYLRIARSLVEVKKSLDQLYYALYLTLYIIAIPSLLLALYFSRKIVSRFKVDGTP
jgi:two-component system phosphate regulon sensor histidine kinase PhoR